MQRPIRRSLAALVSLAVLAGCTTIRTRANHRSAKTAIGGAIGAATGAAIGAIADKENRGRGAAIGAGVGVLAGGAVGAYMDYQEKKLREKLAGTGVSVKRVGDDIFLNMPGNLTSRPTTPRSAATSTTCSTRSCWCERVREDADRDHGPHRQHGSDAHNQQLSEARANSVAAYFRSRQVIPQRLITHGFGERFPIAATTRPTAVSRTGASSCGSCRSRAARTRSGGQDLRARRA
jgi:outer membrane protein OmpA-like peptidoglycan-associated protein